PRNPKEGVLCRDILFLIVVVSGILTVGTLGVFFLELREGADATRARTVAFTTIVFFELFLVFAMRSPRQTIWQIGLFTNTKLIVAVLGSMALQVAVIYTPFLHGVFETEPLTPLDWLETVLISFTAFAFVGVLHVLRRRPFFLRHRDRGEHHPGPAGPSSGGRRGPGSRAGAVDRRDGRPMVSAHRLLQSSVLALGAASRSPRGCRGSPARVLSSRWGHRRGRD